MRILTRPSDEQHNCLPSLPAFLLPMLLDIILDSLSVRSSKHAFRRSDIGHEFCYIVQEAWLCVVEGREFGDGCAAEDGRWEGRGREVVEVEGVK